VGQGKRELWSALQNNLIKKLGTLVLFDFRILKVEPEIDKEIENESTKEHGCFIYL
jgi:hypothetical protein